MVNVIQTIKHKWKEVKEEKLATLEVVIRQDHFDFWIKTQRMKSARSKQVNTQEKRNPGKIKGKCKSPEVWKSLK